MRLPLLVVTVPHFLFGAWLWLGSQAAIRDAWEERQLYERGPPSPQMMSFDGPMPLTLPMFVRFAAWGTAGFLFASSALGVWLSPGRVWGWVMLALMTVHASLGLYDSYLFTIYLPESDVWPRLIDDATELAWLAFVARALQIERKL